MQLYAHQQDLGNCRTALDKEVERYHWIVGQREAKEKEVEALKSRAAERKKTEGELIAKRQALQAEVDELHRSIAQVKAYQVELNDEVRVSQSMTSNDERQLVREEKIKAEQDKALLHLTERLHTLQHDHSTLSLQCAAQTQENKQLNGVLTQLKEELALLTVERKDFSDRWRATVRQNQVKGDAIAMAERMIDQLREQIRSLSLSVISAQKATRSHQAEHQQLVAFHSRLVSEHEYLQGQVELIAELKEKYSANYAIILKTTGECEEELRRLNHTMGRVESDVAMLDQQANGLRRKSREMEEVRGNKVNEELILEKNSEAIWKKIRAKKSELSEFESELIKQSNEMARTKIDLLNTQQHNSQLKQTNLNYQAEIAKKDELIDGYEVETGKRHEMIAKKQNDIIRLNRELERYNAVNALAVYNETVGNEGPLEIQIANLNKKIHSVVASKEESQRRWIQIQNEFVHVKSQCEEVETATANKASELSVRVTKAKSVSMQAEQAAHQEQTLAMSVRQVRSHGGKMNEWIEEFRAKKEQLSHQNFLTQKEFLAELKEKETAAGVRMEQLQALRERKESEKTHMLNVEYQVMQMARKLEVEKETQALLDPTVGQQEIAQLRQQNAGLELCIQGAVKQKERMTLQVLRGIEVEAKERHPILALDDKQKQVKAKAMQQQQIYTAKVQCGKKAKERAQLTAFCQHLSEEAAMIQHELVRQQSIYNTVELSKLTVDAEVDGLSLDVRMAREHLILTQAKAKKLEERMGKVRKVEAEDERKRKRERLEEEKEKGKQRYARLLEEIKRVGEEHPAHAAFITRLLQWA